MNRAHYKRAKLLDSQPVPVRKDIFLHDVSPFSLGLVREAIGQGLKPYGLDLSDDGTVLILRFAKPEPSRPPFL